MAHDVPGGDTAENGPLVGTSVADHLLVGAAPKDGPLEGVTTPEPSSERSTRARAWALPLLLLLLAVLHVPSLSLGRVRDDHYVLELCRVEPWGRLLVDGFRFPKTDFGSPWWIPHEEICHFFRPLVLASFKASIALFGPDDLPQRLGNVLLHMATVLGLVAVARRLGFATMSAVGAGAFFAFSYLNQWTVMWIVARKELMVGAFLVWAFWAHLGGRPLLRLLCATGAMFSGEHGATLPFLLVFWDLLQPEREAGMRRPWREIVREKAGAWLPLFGLLAVYLVLRWTVLGGLSLPPAPYFWAPWEGRSWLFYGMKLLLFATSLSWHDLFMDRPLFTLWLDHPWTALLMAALSVFVIRWAWRSSGRSRIFLAAGGMALLVFGPFLPLPAMPIYLYSPLIFCSVAVAAALNGKTESGRGFRRACALLVALNLLASGAWTWSGWMQRFAYPAEVLPRVRALLADVPVRRPVLLVDCSPHAMSLPWLLARATGRDPVRVAVLTMRDHWAGGPDPAVAWSPDGRLLCRNEARPWWGTANERKLSFFAEGLVRPGARIRGPWFEVRLDALGAPPPLSARGRRFYGNEPGVVALSARFDEGLTPVVIVFRQGVPARLDGGNS